MFIFFIYQNNVMIRHKTKANNGRTHGRTRPNTQHQQPGNQEAREYGKHDCNA